ncbi:hypothetical protein Tco_0899620, partial [Tanacetum coccineum]
IDPDPGDLDSIDLGIRKNVSTTNVNVPLEDDQSSLFAYVVWIFLAFLTYPVVPPYLLSTRNEDTIFDPGISMYHSFMPDVSHRSGTFIKFNDFPDCEDSRACSIHMSFTSSASFWESRHGNTLSMGDSWKRIFKKGRKKQSHNNKPEHGMEKTRKGTKSVSQLYFRSSLPERLKANNTNLASHLPQSCLMLTLEGFPFVTVNTKEYHSECSGKISRIMRRTL